MSVLTTVILDPVSTGAAAPIGPAAGHTPEVMRQRAAAFDDALSRQSAIPAQPPVRLAQAQVQATDAAPNATSPVRADAVDSRERARRALELDGVKEPVKPSGGDLILDGLQKLRGVFDARHARVNGVMDGASIDVSTMLAMQVEVVNYTLLVDVTSKLTGKSTQSFDTLMKGQ